MGSAGGGSATAQAKTEMRKLRLWSEGAMVQARMTAAVTRARSWCAHG